MTPEYVFVRPSPLTVQSSESIEFYETHYNVTKLKDTTTPCTGCVWNVCTKFQEWYPDTKTRNYWCHYIYANT